MYVRTFGSLHFITVVVVTICGRRTTQSVFDTDKSYTNDSDMDKHTIAFSTVCTYVRMYVCTYICMHVLCISNVHSMNIV